MKTELIVLLFTVLLAISAIAETQPVKCQSNINGYKIRNVYITGNFYPGMAHGYKHLSDETCLTPVTDLSKADAILYVHREYFKTEANAAMKRAEPFSVSCSSTAASTHCLDSDGYAMDINCSNGTCTSHYGPSLGATAYELVGDIVRAWVDTRWYLADATLYTTAYKPLWKSEEQKGGADWIEKLRLGTNEPECKRSAFSSHRYKNYRQWASEYCGVEFDPMVSIDLQMQDKLAKQQAKQDATDEMSQNAKEAAAKATEEGKQ